MKSSLDKIFYKVVYHHIIYMCDPHLQIRQLFLFESNVYKLSERGRRLYINILSYYLANKRSLHIRSQGLEILTLIEEK